MSRNPLPPPHPRIVPLNNRRRPVMGMPQFRLSSVPPSILPPEQPVRQPENNISLLGRRHPPPIHIMQHPPIPHLVIPHPPIVPHPVIPRGTTMVPSQYIRTPPNSPSDNYMPSNYIRTSPSEYGQNNTITSPYDSHIQNIITQLRGMPSNEITLTNIMSRLNNLPSLQQNNLPNIMPRQNSMSSNEITRPNILSQVNSSASGTMSSESLPRAPPLIRQNQIVIGPEEPIDLISDDVVIDIPPSFNMECYRQKPMNEQYINLEKLEEKGFVCCICTGVIYGNVTITECLHKYCSECLGGWFRDSYDGRPCPTCRTPLNSYNVEPCPYIQEFLDKEPLKCIHKECDIVTERKTYLTHLESCQYTKQTCSFCSGIFFKTTVTDHELVCTQRKINCELCLCRIKFNDLRMHLETVCSMASITCSGCNKEGSRGEIIKHETTECDKRYVDCPFECKSEVRFTELDTHKKMCTLRSIECNWCHKQVLSKNKRSHNKACPHTPLKCDFCGEDTKKGDYSGHKLHTCIKYPLLCTEGCETYIERQSMSNHILTMCHKRKVFCNRCNELVVFGKLGWHDIVDCPNITITCSCGQEMYNKELKTHLSLVCPDLLQECKFKFAGCQSTFKRKEAFVHEESYMKEHLNLVYEYSKNKFMLNDEIASISSDSEMEVSPEPTPQRRREPPTPQRRLETQAPQRRREPPIVTREMEMANQTVFTIIPNSSNRHSLLEQNQSRSDDADLESQLLPMNENEIRRQVQQSYTGPIGYGYLPRAIPLPVDSDSDDESLQVQRSLSEEIDEFESIMNTPD